MKNSCTHMRTMLILIYAWHFFALHAFAQWSSDPLINTPICTALNKQESPCTASDGEGGAIIAWQDYRNGNNYDIYAQRINAAGFVQWTPDGVKISAVTNDQLRPVICSDSVGGAIITWEDNRSGNTEIYAQRISAEGVTLWTPDGAVVSTAPVSKRPAILSDGFGGAIIAYMCINIEDHIYAQRINSAGEMLWDSNGVIISKTARYNENPRIVSDGAEGAIITWVMEYAGTGHNYAQHINSYGVSEWDSNGVKIDDMPYPPNSSRIVSDGAGGAIITWEQNRRDPPYEVVYVQKINAAGVVQWLPDGTMVSTITNPLFPVILSDGTGGAFLSWYDSRNGDYDLYAQRINDLGMTQWDSNGIAISTGLGSQVIDVSQSIIGDCAGGAIITWQDYRSGTSDINIFAQQISAIGTTQWKANGVAISIAAGNQQTPAMVSNDSGGAIIVWQDERNGPADIYASTIFSNGGPTEIKIENEFKIEFTLTQNYPNPFNPSTKINYSIPTGTSQLVVMVSLRIFDLLGREAATLVNETKPAGSYQVEWNAANMPSGVYFYRLQAGSFTQTKKLLLLK